MLKSINTFIFGLSPEERVRKWQSNLRREQRGLDREIRQLDQAISRTKSSLKQVAKRNDTKSCRILAVEIVRSNKQKERLLSSKVQLNSISMQLSSQLSTIKVTGSLQKSTEVMKLSSNLIKLPQLSSTMSQMSEEMMKAGIMDEMLQDTMEANDEDGVEEEADEEVDKVLTEITGGKLSQVGSVTDKPLPEIENESEQANDEELEKMQKQLDGLLRG
ncbi:hypothetical protein E3P92_02584 [Wallemia ichthyophaga]|uniref:Vacuolar protein-sorting-associated protein 24 n=2 Tax=Wallemia ichthyophaga TaxID=245174 RepID=A0A4T0FPU7_WALIC|nr:Charged multivesicular body protein 3 [Wallemia ichthyophaga EXF-994]TIA70652.1 hypothetical protein E3P91_03007 [Wallemia ichthyophaga]EOQ99227.1 Charged multivesicular body protein 3 [Wallemia ichthyophaga EXF-994]TIA81013.1 hypothetical protein E3P98_02340 [Wallemia ichthyophaga]TIA90250.1 hypothetical protein E3P97_02662 [Wallemia ichthyophaga]TIA98850.1 hypothetical protein E3P95_02306 [Wallemia ichthyophaga]